MARIIMKQVDVFTSTPFAGNPAGVVTEADSLSDESMQLIAGELNLSETTFITASTAPGALFRVRFFTPGEEVDLSGHAMIASCYALLEEGRIPIADGVTKAVFETRGGLIQLDVHVAKGSRPGAAGAPIVIAGKAAGTLEKIMLHQSVKGARPATVPVAEIARICGFDASEITRTGLPVEIVSTGFDQLMIPVLHKETIRDLNPDLIKLGLMNRAHGIETNHLFSLDVFDSECTAYLRNFAPALGMWEDPASGTAAAGLASYLLRHGVATAGNMIMDNGKDVGSLARVIVEGANPDDPMAEMRVGGLAVTSITRQLAVEAGQLVVS